MANAATSCSSTELARFRLLGATNPTFFGLYARRRMEMFGATRDDFALWWLDTSRVEAQRLIESVNGKPVDLEGARAYLLGIAF